VKSRSAAQQAVKRGRRNMFPLFPYLRIKILPEEENTVQVIKTLSVAILDDLLFTYGSICRK
jgi:hypothetical protein